MSIGKVEKILDTTSPQKLVSGASSTDLKMIAAATLFFALLAGGVYLLYQKQKSPKKPEDIIQSPSEDVDVDVEVQAQKITTLITEIVMGKCDLSEFKNQTRDMGKQERQELLMTVLNAKDAEWIECIINEVEFDSETLKKLNLVIYYVFKNSVLEVDKQQDFIRTLFEKGCKFESGLEKIRTDVSEENRFYMHMLAAGYQYKNPEERKAIAIEVLSYRFAGIHSNPLYLGLKLKALKNLETQTPQGETYTITNQKSENTQKALKDNEEALRICTRLTTVVE